MITERTWTMVEEAALQALLQHLGLVDAEFEEDATLPTKTRSRTWTKAQRAAQSKRMKAYWRKRGGK